MANFILIQFETTKFKVFFEERRPNENKKKNNKNKTSSDMGSFPDPTNFHMVQKKARNHRTCYDKNLVPADLKRKWWLLVVNANVDVADDKFFWTNWEDKLRPQSGIAFTLHTSAN